MLPPVVRLPMRTFAARFFAVVALGTAAVFTPPLVSLLSPPQLAVPLPFLAAACAYGWAWLLHPRRDVDVYGMLRGAVVALLSYLSFTVLLAVYLQWVMPARPGSPHYREALLLIVAFVWTPFPWLALMAGAIAGEANLHRAHARVCAVAAMARVRIARAAVLRAAYKRLGERAADPRARAIVTMAVSTCLLFAGAALGLVWLHPAHAFSDDGIATSQRLLPGTVALILAMAGWTCGRVLLAVMPATHRLHITVGSSMLAVVAAGWFWIDVAG
jgi:hypothetical protein